MEAPSPRWREGSPVSGLKSRQYLSGKGGQAILHWERQTGHQFGPAWAVSVGVRLSPTHAPKQHPASRQEMGNGGGQGRHHTFPVLPQADPHRHHAQIQGAAPSSRGRQGRGKTSAMTGVCHGRTWHLTAGLQGPCGTHPFLGRTRSCLEKTMGVSPEPRSLDGIGLQTLQSGRHRASVNPRPIPCHYSFLKSFFSYLTPHL